MHISDLGLLPLLSAVLSRFVRNSPKMSDEKVAVVTADPLRPKAEDTSASASVVVAEQELQGWDEKATKKLLRKLDWHLIPFMSLIYL